MLYNFENIQIIEKNRKISYEADWNRAKDGSATWTTHYTDGHIQNWFILS